MQKPLRLFFDNVGDANLRHAKVHVNLPISFDNFFEEPYFKEVGAEFLPLSAWDPSGETPGAYFINVCNTPGFWCPTVFSALSREVLDAVNSGTMLLVFNSYTEGREFEIEHGFSTLHLMMKNYGIPPHGVIVITGSFNMGEIYHKWCLDKNLAVMIDFFYMPCHYGFTNTKIQKGDKTLPIEKAIKDPASKDYMSLNQTVKEHRVSHLYELINRNILDKGMVSGHYQQNYQHGDIPSWTYTPFYSDAKIHEWDEKLQNNLPVSADGDWIEIHPDNSPQGIFNIALYEKTLCSFVTESEFHQNAVFLTEKTTKCLASGHPFILLSAPNSLSYLEKQGFKVDFAGIDNSYDKELNHRKRFQQAHESLNKWVNLSRQEKLECIEQSMPVLQHNANLMATMYGHHSWEISSYIKERFQEMSLLITYNLDSVYQHLHG